jgi:hypothetical protein
MHESHELCIKFISGSFHELFFSPIKPHSRLSTQLGKSASNLFLSQELQVGRLVQAEVRKICLGSFILTRTPGG